MMTMHVTYPDGAIAECRIDCTLVDALELMHTWPEHYPLCWEVR